MIEPAPFEYSDVLTSAVHSHQVPDVNGLNVHVLEAGDPDAPTVVLLHGFPELAYSWRKLMLPLVDAGYHVLAPDLRGYGRTTGADHSYGADLTTFRMGNFVIDSLALLFAKGISEVACVVGHDYGSPVAAHWALIRPDVFRSVVLMSAPYGGGPSLPFAGTRGAAVTRVDIEADLAAQPRPRKHYRWYYSTPLANDDMWHARQGVHDFLRAYYHMKSAAWEGNIPHPLAGWQADEIAKMPTYYVMDAHETMAETVEHHMPTSEEIRCCEWLTEEELSVYSREYERTGFQGGLQSYRCGVDPSHSVDLRLFARRTIDVPSMYVAGAQDWGVYQTPGALEAMQNRACTDMRGVHLIEGAGHWVQQEQPAEVMVHLLTFLEHL